MTLGPGTQRAVDKMQALIDAAPKHPLYDVVINLEAMGGHPDIVIGWRGKVQWTPEAVRIRQQAQMEILRYAPHAWLDPVPPPVWGNDISTDVFMFEAAPEDVFHAVMKMIDANFLRTLEDTRIADHKWVWTKGARFA